MNRKLLLIILATLPLLLVSCGKKQVAPVLPPPPVTTALPIVADTPQFNSYVGHVAPFIQVEVRSQVEGVLTGYYFTEGQEVERGDLIFTIDSRPYEAQLSKAEAALAMSIANMRFAQETAERNAKLAQDEYVARLQYDEYLTKVETTQADIQAAQADIETAKINISYCNIHSPTTGVMGKLEFNVGNLISNAGTTPLITLNQITPVYVYFSVPQDDLPQIMRLQRQGPLKVEAYLPTEQKPYVGTLNFIDNQVDDKTGAIWMRGIFANEEKMLWPGEFAQIRLILAVDKNALRIPSEAIQITQKGPMVFVVKEDQTVELRPVVPGQRIDDQIVITSGLKAGERVVVEGQINLSPGVKVTVK